LAHNKFLILKFDFSAGGVVKDFDYESVMNMIINRGVKLFFGKYRDLLVETWYDASELVAENSMRTLFNLSKLLTLRRERALKSNRVVEDVSCLR
jgi:hypothetical protein